MTWTSSFQKCAEIIVAHLGYLNYTQYRVTVGFEHLNQPIKDMNFTVSVPCSQRPASVTPLLGGLMHQGLVQFISENQLKCVELKNRLIKQPGHWRSQGALSQPAIPRLASCL